MSAEGTFYSDGLMNSRITLSLDANNKLELWLNKEGRDQLVRELQALDENNDHFHMMLPDYAPSDLPLMPIPYRTTDTVISAAKVMFRPDDWDQLHYPHVLTDAK